MARIKAYNSNFCDVGARADSDESTATTSVGNANADGKAAQLPVADHGSRTRAAVGDAGCVPSRETRC